MHFVQELQLTGGGVRYIIYVATERVGSLCVF